MDKAKDFSTLRKGISISLVIAILFTCGFVLGALTKAVDSMNVEPAPETTVVTTTQAPTTVAPETTTTAPTTAAPTTTAAPETTTSAPETTTSASEAETTTTTEPSEEGTEEEGGLIAGIIVKLLEAKKKIIDFIISIVSSLPF